MNLTQADEPVIQAEPNRDNNELAELQNALRTCRLANHGLSLLLERTQIELAASNSRVIHLEQVNTHLALVNSQELNLRILAEGTAVDYNSQLLIANFNQVIAQEENIVLGRHIKELKKQTEELQSRHNKLVEVESASYNNTEKMNQKVFNLESQVLNLNESIKSKGKEVLPLKRKRSN